MILKLTEGYVRERAKPDYIFEMKKRIVKFCFQLAELRRDHPEWIPVLKHHVSTVFPVSSIRTTYYNYLQVKSFDEKIFEMMIENSNGRMQQDYHLLQFSPDVLRKLNGFRGRPKRFSSPLVYPYRDSKIIDSLYKYKFWGKIEKDIFDHPTLIIRHEGTDKYFTHLVTDSSPYPVYFQPFLVTSRDIPRLFAEYDTTFEQMYSTMKGLFNIWYGLRF